MHRHTFITQIIIFCLAAVTGISARLYPLQNHNPNESTEKATLLVIASLNRQIQQSIEAGNPGLSPAQKKAAAAKMLNKTIAADRDKFHQAVKTMAAQIPSGYNNARDYPYLLASDSYHFFDLTRQLKEDGHYSDEFRGSKYLNRKMLAPIGHWEPLTWHPYVGLAIDRIFRLFKPDSDLMYTLSFTPLILFVLSLIPLLWLCRIMKFSPLATLLSTMFYSFAPIILKRSMFGWYDNDPYNLIFPPLILGWAIYSLCRFKDTKGYIISGSVMALLFGIYAHFWQGWIFVLCVLAVAVCAALVFSGFKKDSMPGLKPTLYQGVIWAGGTFLIVTFMFGPREIFILAGEGFKALSNFLTPQLSQWPDMYMTVGELHNADTDFILEMNNGWLYVLTGAAGWIYAFVRFFKRDPEDNPTGSIILFTYLCATLFITLGAQRFVMLTTLPLAIGLGLAITGLGRLAVTLGDLKLPSARSRLIVRICLSVILLAVFLTPMTRTPTIIPALLNPIYNDTWDKALTKIRKETPADSIVTTWWPPGHFIKATADRKVTFDGASINYPQAYWLSRIMLETEEMDALGLLALVNNSAHTLAEELMKKTGFKVYQIISLLSESVRHSEPKAFILLKSFLRDPSLVERVLTITHSMPEPSYILLYNEFVENNIQLRFLANWNFKEIEAINNDPKRLAEVPDRRSKDYIDFLWLLAGGPSKYSDELTETGRKGSTIHFPHELSVDLTNHQASINSPKYGRGTPHSVFYLDENGDVQESVVEGTSKPFSVVLYEIAGTYKAVLMDRSLARSMLVRMYFFDAADLEFIEPVIAEEDLTRRTVIKVFRIDWERFFKARNS